MKRIIIIGATSGIGYEVAKGYLKQGWKVGVAGRRESALEKFKATTPETLKTQSIHYFFLDYKINTKIQSKTTNKPK